MGQLTKSKWVYRDTGKRGFTHRIGLKVAEELSYWTSAEEDVDVVVQNVLYVASQGVGLSE